MVDGILPESRADQRPTGMPNSIASPKSKWHITFQNRAGANAARQFVIRVAALSTLAAGLVSGAPFTNGSFETPGLPPGNFGPQGFAGGTTLGAWTVTGNAIDYGATGASFNGVTFSAFHGTYAVDLTGRILDVLAAKVGKLTRQKHVFLSPAGHTRFNPLPYCL
jgi:hypothetical protein